MIFQNVIKMPCDIYIRVGHSGVLIIKSLKTATEICFSGKYAWQIWWWFLHSFALTQPPLMPQVRHIWAFALCSCICQTHTSLLYICYGHRIKKIKKGNCDIGNYRNSDFPPFNSEKKKSVRYKIRIPRYKLRIARYKLIILRSWIWEKNVQLKKKRSKMWDKKKERKKSQLPLSHGRYKLPYYSPWQPRRNVHKQFGAVKNDSLYFAIQK